MKIDPSTGLPELPEGYTWKVYRNSKIRILRNGFRTKHKISLPQVFTSESIKTYASMLANEFYADLKKEDTPKTQNPEPKNFTVYLDKYTTKLPELRVGYRWRLSRRYTNYYYLEIVRETGFRAKLLNSSEMYETDVFPLLFDTYEESLQIDPDWAKGYHNPEDLFSQGLSRECEWDFNRVYNKYLMYNNDFGVFGTYGVDGHPNLYYTVGWFDVSQSRILEIRLHGKFRGYGETTISPDYMYDSKELAEKLKKQIKVELECLLRKKTQIEGMKSLVGKYPPKTLRKDSDG